MAHFAEINQAPSPYSTLQRIGRVATLKLVPKNCLRYLQTTMIMGREGLVSKFMWSIVEFMKTMYILLLFELQNLRHLFINHIAIVLVLCAQHRAVLFNFFMKQYFFLNPNPDITFSQYPLTKARKVCFC